ncbi:MAG: SDR family oxidoreductase [Candidatus Sumerlaeota bacterium]|nr:SDR family oxidoreductase [Candidatus Sumerlaeota bacterium]
MANYLVTGGAGFIGSNIAEYLCAQGESVRVLDNYSTGFPNNLAHIRNKIDLLEGDLRNPDDCRRAAKDMDYILHQAAIPSVPRSVANPLLTHESNVTGTLNLLIAAREACIKRFVYAASSSAYGDQQAEFKVETLLPEPRSPYAVSKFACEGYCKAFSVCYEMETVSLRYFNVFGPRQDPASQYSGVIAKFCTQMLAGEAPKIEGDGGQSRDFTYVENNVLANLLAARAPFNANGEVINIACGASSTVLQLFETLQKILGCNLTPQFAPPRAGDVRHSKADISKARALLGYEPTISFEEGLRRTIEWYRDQAAKE